MFSLARPKSRFTDDHDLYIPLTNTYMTSLLINPVTDTLRQGHRPVIFQAS